MNILVSTASAAIGLSLTRCIGSSGHHVHVERDGGSFWNDVERENPELVVLDATAGDSGWHHVVRQLRSQPVYRFVMVLGIGGPSEVPAAFGVGVDEYLRFPCDPNEFAARLTAIERLMRHVRYPEAMKEDGAAFVAELPAWSNLEANLTTAFSELLCVSSQRVDEVAPSGILYVSRLRLVLTKPRVSVTLYLAASDSALQALAGLLLGAPTDEEAVLRDCCKEALNTLGGAFKHEALPEYDFTSGIPEMANLVRMRQSAKTERFCKSWTMGWGKHSVAMQATLACDEVQVVPLHSLCEGMVLADDIRNPVGVLIAPRGMHLTESAIKRLYSVFGATATLRVSNAA